ncbi:MAG: hypothetical protein AUH30_01185 [Candidatus Rokubacteria bacterium 13_1_40CM_68_15]|nr:MAG: hypothetical protein AUH30_01185 [Candidatus Rokubacteria bacterium 13_1_40CM_68_15]
MQATTTRAWTVMTSMPMTAIRNQASMTMPLFENSIKNLTWLPVGLVLSTTTPHSPRRRLDSERRYRGKGVARRG